MTANLAKDSRISAIEALLRGPSFPQKEFVCGGTTFGEVYAMAAGLQTAIARLEDSGAIICLAAEDKAVIAAALLASLACSSTLLLPYSFSAMALSQLQQTAGYTLALTDTKRDFPEGISILYPSDLGPAKRPLTPRLAPDSLFLQIFTGGSTGMPQMWSKTRENLFGEGLFLAERFAVTENDCILATVPPHHIYGLLYSVILPLVSSASVVGEAPSFPSEILAAATKHRATILASVPAHYRVLRDKEMSLRLALSSAGMLDQEDNLLFGRRNPHGIVEVYGSTETGGIATRNRSQGEEYFTAFTPLQWKIVDRRLAVLSSFISPELPIDVEGYFTTGDRVTKEGPNQFSLQGRTDAVTKVGGKRVDLDEISTLIKKQPGVRDCVVIALPEAGGRGHRLAALIEGETANSKSIKNNLADCLESYALPRRIKKVDRIPITANGKYDRTAIVRLLNK